MKRYLSVLLISLMLCLSFSVNFVSSQTVEATDTTDYDWYVDDIEGSSGPDNPPEDFTRIQDAIDNASSNQSIFVYNGEYNENIVINKPSLTLQGENNENTIINAKMDKETIIIKADHVSLRGFTCLNEFEERKLFIKANSTTIENNKLLGNWGIILINCNNNIINNNFLKSVIAISQSNFNDLENNVFTDGGQIWIISGSSNNIINNIFQNEIITGIFGGSIAVIIEGSISKKNKISYNVIKGCFIGMVIHSSENEISYNDFLFCLIPGMVYYKGMSGTWKHNYYNRPRFIPKFFTGIGGSSYAPYLPFDVDFHPAQIRNCDFGGDN